jgi:hypothetical protein
MRCIKAITPPLIFKKSCSLLFLIFFLPRQICSHNQLAAAEAIVH